jgi:hypothetical protein
MSSDNEYNIFNRFNYGKLLIFVESIYLIILSTEKQTQCRLNNNKMLIKMQTSIVSHRTNSISKSNSSILSLL